MLYWGFMNAEQLQVVEKVKKLMALSKSPSEAEAAAALEKARLLLARYDLSIAELEESEAVGETVLLEKKRLRVWESALVGVVSRASFTEALHYRSRQLGKILLIGREVNLVGARELFCYLHQAILILGRQYSPQVAHVESFRLGVVQRIGERLEESAAAGTTGQPKPLRADDTESGAIADSRALVALAGSKTKPENMAYIRKTYGKTTTRRSGKAVEAGSYHKGRQAAESIGLNKQLAD